MVSGIIKRVNKKPWTDQRSGKDVILYSFTLEGDDNFYGCGQSPIPAGPGQSVTFEMKGKNCNVNTLKVVETQVAEAAPVSMTASPGDVSSAPRVSRGGGMSKDDYWANKEAKDVAKDARFRNVSEPRMALSVATEAAAQVVCAALAADALGFGSTAKSKRLDMLTDYVKAVATDLAQFIHEAPSVIDVMEEE